MPGQLLRDRPPQTVEVVDRTVAALDHVLFRGDEVDEHADFALPAAATRNVALAHSRRQIANVSVAAAAPATTRATGRGSPIAATTIANTYSRPLMRCGSE